MTPVIFSVFIFIFGMLWGSFLNVWVYRTRVGQSIFKPASFCPNCGHTIRWYDLIPVLSFLLLKGKCRDCKKKISLQYPLIELATGVLSVVVFLSTVVATTHPLTLQTIPYVTLIRDLAIVFFLEFVFIYDFLYGEIPDKVTLIPAFVLFLFSLIFKWNNFQNLVIGVLIGAGFFLAQFLISKGRWIGGGDIRLGFFMGVILGSSLIAVALFFAYIGGAILAIPLLLLKKKERQSTLPFGTFLSTATVVASLWGKDIMDWYLSLLNVK